MRKKTLALLALNLLIFFIIGGYLREERESRDKERVDRELFAEAFADAHRIVISRGSTDPEKILLSRKENKWLLEAPFSWPANFFAARGILNGLQHIEATPLFLIEELIGENSTLKDYGLDAPKLQIEVTSRRGTVQLQFGELTPDKLKIYALEPKSKKIYAVDNGLAKDLSQPLSVLMRPEFFDLQVNEIRSLSVRFNQSGTTSTTTISRVNPEGDFWEIVTPIETIANGQLVKGLINQLLSGQVTRFVMDPKQMDSIKEKLTLPSVSLTLEGPIRSQTLIAGELIEQGEDKGLRYARLEGSPTIFTTSDNLFQELRDAQRNLREKRFVRFKREEIDSIEISKGSRKISLHLIEQGEWRVFARREDEEIAQFPADSKVIEDLLTSLAETEAENFVWDAPSESDLAKAGLLPADLTITLGSASSEDQTLMLGENFAENDGTVYAKARNEPFVYAISKGLLEAIPLEQLHYRKRVLETLPQGASISLITLRDLEKNATLSELSMPERPLEELPLEDEIAIRTAELSGMIREFEVREYLPGSFQKEGSIQDNEQIAWRYELAAEIALPGGDSNVTESRTYLFSERLGGTSQIGGTPDFDAIFKLEQSMIDLIQAIARNPNAPLSPQR
tara:strand:+ start:4117 stop:5991 length:1875 start_codon:yes stop_codon:yes gene_type:complete